MYNHTHGHQGYTVGKGIPKKERERESFPGGIILWPAAAGPRSLGVSRPNNRALSAGPARVSLTRGPGPGRGRGGRLPPTGPAVFTAASPLPMEGVGQFRHPTAHRHQPQPQTSASNPNPLRPARDVARRMSYKSQFGRMSVLFIAGHRL